MEVFLLVDGTVILDRCKTSTKEKAQLIFLTEGWITGEIISEADYEQEVQLNSYESLNL